ncbi:hypothetical protein BDW68DRAFT_154177 [Aspergillus falconensis]
MQTSGLTNAPLTKALLIYTIASSIALSIFDIKHLASIYISPHIFPYGQFWRCLVWQVAGFANSTEALFAALLFYHCRVVERGWGARKVATFIFSTLPYTTLLPPLILTLVVKPLTSGKMNYLPSGPTATVFALLAQYHASIPSTYRYTISTSTSMSTSTPNSPSSQPQDAAPKPSPLTLSLTDKSTTYLIAAQLSLSQFPHMLFPSAIGWIVGVAWRAEALPFAAGSGSSGWRVPGWVVGEERVAFPARGGGNEAQFEGLRRRLESEAAAASAAVSGSADGSAGSSANAGPFGSGLGSSRQRVVRG